MLARALADGGFTQAQLALPAPPDRPEHTRLVDLELSLALTALKQQGRIANPARGVWRVADAPARPKRVDPRAEYRAYLASDAWQERRARALAEAGGRCQIDASHEGPLDVHHNTYERLGAELPGDLIVLCRACHGRHHGHELAARRRGASTSQVAAPAVVFLPPVDAAPPPAPPPPAVEPPPRRWCEPSTWRAAG